MNRQICHMITGRASSSPPYMAMRMRVLRPSTGSVMISDGTPPSEVRGQKSGLRRHSRSYGSSRKPSTWS